MLKATLNFAPLGTFTLLFNLNVYGAAELVTAPPPNRPLVVEYAADVTPEYFALMSAVVA
jgi:hypothetical protein